MDQSVETCTTLASQADFASPTTLCEIALLKPDHEQSSRSCHDRVLDLIKLWWRPMPKAGPTKVTSSKLNLRKVNDRNAGRETHR
jgi:hypothetical protein